MLAVRFQPPAIRPVPRDEELRLRQGAPQRREIVQDLHDVLFGAHPRDHHQGAAVVGQAVPAEQLRLFLRGHRLLIALQPDAVGDHRHPVFGGLELGEMPRLFRRRDHRLCVPVEPLSENLHGHAHGPRFVEALKGVGGVIGMGRDDHRRARNGGDFKR